MKTSILLLAIALHSTRLTASWVLTISNTGSNQLQVVIGSDVPVIEPWHYELQSSTDCVSWTSISTNVVLGGLGTTNTVQATNAMTFYRAKVH